MNGCPASAIVLVFACLAFAGPAWSAGDAAGLLAETDVFKGLPGPQLESVAGLVASRQAEKGECLIRTGEPVAHLFFLKSGEGAVCLADGTELARVGPGYVVGEMELVSGKPPTADVVMKTSGEVLTVEFDALRKLMDADPALGYRVMENIALKVCSYAESRARGN